MKRRGWTTTALVALGLLAAGCSEDAPVTAPIDPIPQPRPKLDGIAIRLNVDVVRGQVTIASPKSDRSEAAAAPNEMPPSGGRPSFAILGRNEVLVTPSEFCRSDDPNQCPIGPPSPGKVRIRFDVTLTNLLTGSALVTPTFPPPRLGEQGLILFPFSVFAISERGAVTANSDWDSGPRNFFNDAVCAEGEGSDCYRYESFPSPLGPGATSEKRTIGFDLDPQVGSFGFDLVIAADVQNGVPADQLGAIGGIVGSPQRGPLFGVTITAGGQSTTTFPGRARPGEIVSGARYLIGDVPPGDVTVTLSTLPEGCTAPEPELATVTAGQATTVDFSVTCTATTGMIGGTVSSPARGRLGGVTVTASPGGQSGVTNPPRPRGVVVGPQYLIVNVPPGDVTLTLSTLPEGCTAPEPQTAPVVVGQVTTVDFTVTCTPPGIITGVIISPQRGPLAGVTVTASPSQQSVLANVGSYVLENAPLGEVTLTLSTLPVGCSDPGPQTGTVTSGGVTRLEFFVTCTGLGSIIGTIITPREGPNALTGVTVTALPSGQSAFASCAFGARCPAFGIWDYRIDNVPEGSVTLIISDLPDGCFDPGPRTVIVTAGAATEVEGIEVSCTRS